MSAAGFGKHADPPLRPTSSAQAPTHLGTDTGDLQPCVAHRLVDRRSERINGTVAFVQIGAPLQNALRESLDGSELVFFKDPRGSRLVDVTLIARVIRSGCDSPTGLALVLELGAGLPLSFGAR